MDGATVSQLVTCCVSQPEIGAIFKNEKKFFSTVDFEKCNIASQSIRKVLSENA